MTNTPPHEDEFPLHGHETVPETIPAPPDDEVPPTNPRGVSVPPAFVEGEAPSFSEAPPPWLLPMFSRLESQQRELVGTMVGELKGFQLRNRKDIHGLRNDIQVVSANTERSNTNLELLRHEVERSSDEFRGRINWQERELLRHRKELIQGSDRVTVLERDRDEAKRRLDAIEAELEMTRSVDTEPPEAG